MFLVKGDEEMESKKSSSLSSALLALIFLLSVFPIYLSAQEKTLEEMTIEELMNITVTASRYEQKITDAPALVTIITAQEIEEMGARTIMDVLLKVPGFNHLQDINEHVLSVRGVYASTNHKFLFLRDGHRLNEPMWEASDYAYSISLSSIKRIEIMRGPGASLYGNAALTAVINIITKDADELNGYYIEGKSGNYGQYSFEGMFGQKWDESSLLLYAMYSSIDGEKVSVPIEDDYQSVNKTTGEMYVDKFPNNFDLGFKFINNSLTLLGSLHRSHYAQPKGNSGQTIDWANEWHSPEQVFLNSHLALNYQLKIKEVEIIARPFLDHSSLDGWQLLATRRDAPPEGKIFEISTSTIRYGLEVLTNYTYSKGKILAGIKAEKWELLDSYLLNNFADSSTVTRFKEPLVPKGTESNGAGFIQAQHTLFPSLILNMGLRYDYYQGFGVSFNPRMAVIVNPLPYLSLKAIYGKSFQAPSYFYRNSNPGLGYRGTNLGPEKMEEIQFAARVSLKNYWFGEISYFYNQLKDLISRDNTYVPAIYRNFGKMTAQGFEFETKYHIQNFSGFANYTYLIPVTDNTDKVLIKENTFINIPDHTANLGITLRPFTNLSTTLMLHWNDKIYSPIPGNLDNTLDSKVITDFIIILKEKPNHMSFSISIHNLFNECYKLGGTVPPYLQQGRWILSSVGYSF